MVVMMRRLIWCAMCVGCIVMMAGCAQGGLQMLKADGTRIVDERGEQVQLRGVNLGGWLVEEMWMMPFATWPPEGSEWAQVKDSVSLWRVIEGRLGKGAAGRVKTALREAWLNESDFDRMKKAGFNCVRLPFFVALLDEPGGMEYLEKAVAWAEERGIYVVLDMHGAPGCQSKDHHSGVTERNEFFKKDENVEAACRAWEKVARLFAGRKAVAGYDLLNEPMGAENPATMHAAHDRLYRAIRAVDKEHMIFVEDGYKGADTFPLPSAAGWKNVVYSLHVYGFTSQSAADQLAKLAWLKEECEKVQAMYGVPVYVGEFNQEPHGTRETMQAFVDEMVNHGWAFAQWSYKQVVTKGRRNMWGYYRNPHPVEAIDPFRDSEAEMIRKCELYRTEKLEAEERLVGVLGEVRDDK